MTPPTTRTSTAATKLCHILKRPDFEGYGFNLHSEKIKPGQYIGKVDANSPAEAASLKEGDQIIEVNGIVIGSETHKQVVQRIKAIACEVRLLLIDVDGNGGKDVISQDKTFTVEPNHGNNSSNNNTSAPKKGNTANGMAESAPTDRGSKMMEYHGIVQEIPGASANISSISMISTKRLSSSSSQSEGCFLDDTGRTTHSAAASHNGTKALITHEFNDNDNQRQRQFAMSKHNNSNVMTSASPLSRSAAIATVPEQQKHSEHATLSMSGNLSPPPPSVNMKGSNSINQAGGLQLPMTAAEMRAKLMSKKKYDPKNESVDVMKKFEIIQKL